MEVFRTRRFGEIEVGEKDIITLHEGLIGFSNCKRYVLLEREEELPFMWLQSLDEPELAFVTVDPLVFFPDYQVRVPKADLTSLGVEEEGDLRVTVLVVLSRDPSRITANLKGPIVLNSITLQGKQLVLIDDEYQTQHPLMSQLTEAQES